MTTPAVMFPVGKDHYAVATSVVLEVVAEPRPTRLPTAPLVLLGAFNLRGAVIPAFDTAALLGIGRISHPGVAVVVSTTAGTAALVVDGLPTYVELDNEVGQSQLRGARGVYNVHDAVVVMLDVEALLVSRQVPSDASALTVDR